MESGLRSVLVCHERRARMFAKIGMIGRVLR
jgi:hypothetical protein